MTNVQFEQTTNALIRYLQLEDDTRGFKLKGRGGPIRLPMRSDILAHDEDERLITPLLRLLERGMDSEIILLHIERFPYKLQERKRHLDEERYWCVVHNVKTFLKSLYARLSEENIDDALRQSVITTLKTL